MPVENPEEKETMALALGMFIFHTVAFRIAVRMSKLLKLSNGLIDSRARAKVS